jgi:hypothetical protein
MPDLIISEVEYAPRKIILEVAKLNPAALTMLDALDMADASGIKPQDFTNVLQGKDERSKVLVLYAFAWVIGRRLEPGLTFQEVCTYQLEVIGKPPTKIETEAAINRAKTTVNLAMMAGITPDEAEQLTVAEAAAVVDIQKQRRRRR